MVRRTAYQSGVRGFNPRCFHFDLLLGSLLCQQLCWGQRQRSKDLPPTSFYAVGLENSRPLTSIPQRSDLRQSLTLYNKLTFSKIRPFLDVLGYRYRRKRIGNLHLSLLPTFFFSYSSVSLLVKSKIFFHQTKPWLHIERYKIVTKKKKKLPIVF